MCPSTGYNWFFDHCETISDRNMERVKAPRRRHRHPGPHGLSGGILCQSLWRRSGAANTADLPHAESGDSGRGRNRCHQGFEL